MSGPDTWPASLWQRFALTLDRARPGAILGPGFTMNTVLRIRGPLRLTVLAAAVDELVRRHDVLRTRLALDGAEPLQVVTPQVTGLLEVLEGPDVPEPDGWTHAPVASDRSTPMRVRVAQVDVDEHILALHLHHLMADPVTLWTVVDELAALYGSALGVPRHQHRGLPTGSTRRRRRTRPAPVGRPRTTGGAGRSVLPGSPRSATASVARPSPTAPPASVRRRRPPSNRCHGGPGAPRS